MSEFKFACPECGQHIAAEESCGGTQIQCPTCQAAIFVPRVAVPIATPAPARPSLASPPPPLPPQPAPVSAPPGGPQVVYVQAPPQKFSGMAIAALVLALLTFPLNMFSPLVGFPLGLLSCIPAVFCGHAALGQIRGSRMLRGKGLAITGLVIGYLVLAVTLLAVGTLIYFKATGKDPRRMRTQRSSMNEPVRRVKPSDNAGLNSPSTQPPMQPVPPRPTDPPVTTNPNTVEIPSTSVSGTIYGKAFDPKVIYLRGFTLTFAQDAKVVPEADLNMVLFGATRNTLQDRTFVVSRQPSPMHPVVRFTQRQGTPEAGILSKDYVMRLEFGKQTGNTIAGKIYFEAPKSYNTVLSGTFVAELK